MLFTKVLYRRADRFASARQWVRELRVSDVPVSIYRVRYDRSSGPGGQNVNKVSTKCTLTIPGISRCEWLPSEVRGLLTKGVCVANPDESNAKQIVASTLSGRPSSYYYPANDKFIVRADETRSREQNRRLCLDKLVREIQDTCRFPGVENEATVSKWDSIKKQTNKIRLEGKRQVSEKKSARKKPRLDQY